MTIDHSTKFGWAVLVLLVTMALSTVSLAVNYGEFKGTVISQRQTQGDDIATIKNALMIKSLANN